MNWKNELENESEHKIKQHAHSHTHFIFFAQLRSKLSLQNRRNPNLAPHNLLKKNKPSGSIHVILTFFGSETRFGPLLSRKETRYPCLGSGTTYGDSERINVVEKLDGTLLASPVSKQGKQGKSAGLVVRRRCPRTILSMSRQRAAERA